MPHFLFNRRSDLNLKQDDSIASKRFVIERKADTALFYEMEEAVVLDVIYDETHPHVQKNAVDVDEIPPNIDGKKPEPGSIDYGRIGCIKFRFLQSEKNKEKERLNWAYPMENTGITEWPLLNEKVVVVEYSKKWYYTRKLNFKSLVNSNASFKTERINGREEENFNEYTGEPYEGPLSKMNYDGGKDYEGVLGYYFKFNNKIRALKRYEGDTIFESRFGSTIRFGAYDSNRTNDNGLGEYADGGGNPKILIRNRQAPIKGEQGKFANGYTEEDVNKDGSSIHITSGKTESSFSPTTKKVMFRADIKEEQPGYSPDGATDFNYPKQDGDQIVINSDRLIFSSKANETFHFSKKRYAVVTDDEYTVDSHKQIVLTTNERTTINSPFIFLGQFEKAVEPVLMGRTTTNWNMALCDWILLQTNWMIELCEEWLAKHVHKDDTGRDMQFPPKSEWEEKLKKQVSDLKKLRESLIKLRDDAPKNMSQRVFVVGGGGAPGLKGGELAADSAMDENSENLAEDEAEKEKQDEEDENKKTYKLELIYEGGGENSPVPKSK
jgi:hypothetical protein